MKLCGYNFDSEEILVLEFSDNRVLFNTRDICRLLNIKERKQGTELEKPCLDLSSAIRLATLLNEEDFTNWLVFTFKSYKLGTLTHPRCDDAWSYFEFD